MTTPRASTDSRRLGLLGCGAFARLYHVPVLRVDPRVALVAICDPAPAEETRRLARETGARLTATAEDLWDACEAVIVSTPHALHAQHVRAALDAGRHVLVDKPFVLASDDARALDAAARARGLVNAVAFNRRFDPGSRRARELVQGGALGPIRHVETVQLGYPAAGWVTDPALGGGGPFVGRGAHMADLVPWLLGRRPDRVRARIRPGGATRVDHGGFIEADFDGLAGQMTVLADGLFMWDEVRVFGEAGFLELRRPLGQPLGWALTHHGPKGELRETVPADPAIGAATLNFLDTLEGRAIPACSFAEAWLSVRWIEAACQSAEAGGPWIDL
jgi:predicted dehydrogenase